MTINIDLTNEIQLKAIETFLSIEAILDCCEEDDYVTLATKPEYYQAMLNRVVNAKPSTIRERVALDPLLDALMIAGNTNIVKFDKNLHGVFSSFIRNMVPLYGILGAYYAYFEVEWATKMFQNWHKDAEAVISKAINSLKPNDNFVIHHSSGELIPQSIQFIGEGEFPVNNEVFTNCHAVYLSPFLHGSGEISYLSGEIFYNNPRDNESDSHFVVNDPDRKLQLTPPSLVVPE